MQHNTRKKHNYNKIRIQIIHRQTRWATPQENQNDLCNWNSDKEGVIEARTSVAIAAFKFIFPVSRFIIPSARIIVVIYQQATALQPFAAYYWHRNLPTGKQSICTSLQTDNHTQHPVIQFLQAECSTPNAQPTVSKHWRQMVWFVTKAPLNQKSTNQDSSLVQ